MQTTIEKTMTIQQLVDAWPCTLEVLVANGFENLKDPAVRSAVGRVLTIERAAGMKGYGIDTFIGLLQHRIDEMADQADVTMKQTERANSDISVAGLLPCPVRIPLLEGFDRFIEGYTAQTGLSVSYKLEAAAVGADWMAEHVAGLHDERNLPDLFLSAGFDTFFDRKTIGRFKDQGIYCDITPKEVNRDFDGLKLKDPKGDYGVLSVVAAVFMVNHEVLGDRPVPRTWADILKPEFAQNVALPVGDFDLFNAILLTIYRQFGDEGIRKLGKSMLKSMHPSQMIKNAQRVADEKPIVTIMPYFFTKMAAMVKSLEIVWPQDGAIISPIFMLAKKSRQAELQPIGDFLAGKEIGEILAQRGLFPSLHTDVDNQLPAGTPWQWVGWDFIYSNDIPALIKHTTLLFETSMNEG